PEALLAPVRGVFTAERENRLEEYTASFMGALTLINPISSLSHYKENSFLKPLIQYQTVEVTNIQRQIFKSIIERVYANNEFSLNVAISLLDAIINSSSAKAEDLGELKEQLELFKQLDQLLISYKGFLARDNIKKHLPSLALLFLAKFSNKSRQNTDKQAVRISFIENEFNFPINITEYVLGFLGLYYGYKNMIKEDTNLRFEDKVFSRIAYNVQSIKFKLDSYFERFILESIFRYVVNQQKQLNNNFDFLQWDEVIRDNRSPFNLDSEEFEYSDHSFTVLGHKILRLERIDKTERVFQKIEMEYSDSIQDSSYLFAFFKKYFKLDKWYLLEILKKNKGRIRREELEKILELDKKHRN
ncbi:MAG TPA: hypothetical protein VNS32_04780, partial [Flavisolibacter sp.]|nr:hypothetical protein [Flavisolibacter sp.]